MDVHGGAMVRVDVQGPQVEEFVRVCPVLVASWLRDDLVEVFLGMELLVAGPGTAAYQPVQRGQVRRPGVQPQPQVSRAFCSEIAGVLSSTIGISVSRGSGLRLSGCSVGSRNARVSFPERTKPGSPL